MANSKLPRHAWMLSLGILLFIIPLLLSISWGAYFDDAAFQTLQAAQVLNGELAASFAAGKVTQAPLYAGLLAAAGTYAPQVALAASALGWGVTAVLILAALRAAGRPSGGVAAALLLVFSPLVITTSGTAYSWMVALGWAALALTIWPDFWGLKRSWAAWVKSVLLLCFLGMHFDAATIVFALTLLAVDVYKGRTGWLPFFVVAAAALLWGVFAGARFGYAGAVDPLLWLRNGAALWADQPLMWLFLPFVLAGLWDVWSWETATNGEQPGRGWSGGQEFFGFLLLWGVTAVLARSTAAPVVVTVTAIVLAGLGAAWLARAVLASGRFAVEGRRAAVLVPLLLVTPLLLVSLAGLWRLYSLRPVMQAALQSSAATWLWENSDAEATLYAAPRTGYLAGRATIPALVAAIRDSNVDAVTDELLRVGPDYIVSENSFAWDYITRSTWFKDRYEVQARFANDYAPDSPVTVWGASASPFDSGAQEALRAVVDERFALVGYQFDPQIITPGDDVFLTLYLEALEPVTHGFITGVDLAAADGWVWVWRREQTPRSFAGEWWAPGQVIPERIRLQTTKDLPLGAYDLQVFWHAGDQKSNWPVVRDGDENVLDRISLGSIIAPAPVDASGATPVNAQFGESIALNAFEYSAAVPGEAWEVTLFWEALSKPQADYTVFVHVLDADGRLAAAHDGMPAENSFPTGAWKPGLIISDSHVLELPADMAPGSYEVEVGLYLLETGERLAVWDAGGLEQVERSMPLAAIEIGD